MLRAADDSCRAVLFFPHYHLNQLLHVARLFEHHPHDPINRREMFLFMHEKFLQDRPRALCLDIAIRDAWLTLRGDTALLQVLVEQLVSNQSYMRLMYRACGMHNLPAYV